MVILNFYVLLSCSQDFIVTLLKNINISKHYNVKFGLFQLIIWSWMRIISLMFILQRLASDFLSNYIFLSVGRVGSSTDLIQQKIVFVEEMDKKDHLRNLLQEQRANGNLGKVYGIHIWIQLFHLIFVFNDLKHVCFEDFR